MQKRTVLKIYGRVQGVFFRNSSQRKARKLNLSGFVRNEPDGTVQIMAEGEEKNLKEFIDWCQDGTIYAKVKKVDIEWFPAIEEFDGFEIK